MEPTFKNEDKFYQETSVWELLMSIERSDDWKGPQKTVILWAPEHQEFQKRRPKSPEAPIQCLVHEKQRRSNDEARRGGWKTTSKFITSHRFVMDVTSRKLLTRPATLAVKLLHYTTNVVNICWLDTHISLGRDQSRHSCAIDRSIGQVSRKFQSQSTSARCWRWCSPSYGARD